LLKKKTTSGNQSNVEIKKSVAGKNEEDINVSNSIANLA